MVTSDVLKPLLKRIPQVAEALNVSNDTVRRLIYAGMIEHVRIGRTLFVSEGSLNRFIEQASTRAYDPNTRGLRPGSK